MSHNFETPINNLSPHYTNSYFKTARAVWGGEEPGLLYDYSDRLWQWDYDKAEAARVKANAVAKNNTALWCQTFLSAYFEKPVELRHIMAGFNLSNGYPYQVFGYRFVEGT